MAQVGSIFLIIVVGYLYWQQAARKVETRQDQQYYQQQVEDCQRRAGQTNGNSGQACF